MALVRRIHFNTWHSAPKQGNAMLLLLLLLLYSSTAGAICSNGRAA
jgi:hypothetical protein